MTGWSSMQLAGFGAAIAVLVLYPLVMRFLSEQVEPARVRLDELGRELLSSPHASEWHKEIVDYMVESSYDWRFMARVALRIPVFLLGRLLNIVAPVPPPPAVKDEATRTKLTEFMSLFMRATAAANPICTIIVALELGALVMVMLPLGMLSRFTDLVWKFFAQADHLVNFRHFRPS